MAQEVTPDAIMQLGFGYWGSKTLLTAVELGLFTELAGGPLSLDDIRVRLTLHERGVRDFLDALVALGMLEREQGKYTNTPATDLYLDRTKPTYIGGVLEMMSVRLFRLWAELTEGVKTGRPQNEAKHGGDIFDAIYTTRARTALAGCARQASSRRAWNI
jgi:Dimerisation domain